MDEKNWSYRHCRENISEPLPENNGHTCFLRRIVLSKLIGNIVID